MKSNTILLLLSYGMIQAALRAVMDHTYWGGRFKAYLLNWRTDSPLFLVLCAMTVATFSMLAIFAIGMILHHYHI